MNERQAQAQGLYYTGMSFRGWDTETATRYAEEVKELKKKYNVRVVKVRQSNGWSSYYGDKNFHLVHHDNIETLQERLDKYIPSKIETAQKMYQEALDRIEQERIEIIEKMNKVKEIMK